MAEYTISARTDHVLKDGKNINATQECNRLAEENRRLVKVIHAMRIQTRRLLEHAVTLDNVINPKVKDGK